MFCLIELHNTVKSRSLRTSNFGISAFPKSPIVTTLLTFCDWFQQICFLHSLAPVQSNLSSVNFCLSLGEMVWYHTSWRQALIQAFIIIYASKRCSYFNKNNFLSYFVSGVYVILRKLFEQYTNFTLKTASKCSWLLYRSQLFTNIENVLQCDTECACHRSAPCFCNNCASRVARSAVPTCPYQLLCAFSRNMKKTT